MRIHALPFLLVAACGARTPLGAEPTPAPDTSSSSGPAACSATESTRLLALPSFDPHTTTAYSPISGLTVHQGALYFSTPVYYQQVSTAVPQPGIASLPVGGGAMTLLAPTSTAGFVSPFVLDDSTLTYLDVDMFQIPLKGGTPTMLGATPPPNNGFLTIAAASDGFFVTLSEDAGLEHVSPSGDVSTLTLDPLTQFTSKLVQDGGVVFGASETGLYRVDGGVVTLLSGESSFDLAVDSTYVYFTIRMKDTTQRLIGARVPKLGGDVTYFVSPDPADFSGVYSGYNGVAVDDTYAYFGDQGSVRAVSKSTGAVGTVGVGTAIVATSGVAVDDKCVYWTNDDNTIWAAPLPP